MFSPILVATALATLQADDPIARLSRYMEGASHYVTTYAVSDAKDVKLADCTWEISRPMTQRLTAKSGKYDFEFVQSPSATVYFAHHDKQYVEWPVFDELLPPPPDAKLLQIVYPAVLLNQKPLRQFKWSAPKSVEVNGKKVDEIDATQKGQGEITLHLFIDDVGRLARFYSKTVGPMGVSEYTFDFTSHERISALETNISTRLPDGYVPFNVKPLNATVTSPSKVPDTKVFDASGASETKLDFGGRPTVVIFTAPDCDVSGSMRKTIAKAYATYGKEAKFLEVSLGPDKPSTQGRDSSIPLYWDKEGKVERSWGINYTPYVLVIKKDGVVDRGFGGYGPDQEASFLKVIGAGVKGEE